MTQDEGLAASGEFEEVNLVSSLTPEEGGKLKTNNLAHSKEADEDLMESLSNFSRDLDLDIESQGWQVSKSKKSKRSKKKAKKAIVVGSRASNKIVRDGVSIADKAQNMVSRLNNTSGIFSLTPPQDNPFTF